jgi:hypothetical protein
MSKPNKKNPLVTLASQGGRLIQGSKEFTIIEYLHSGRSLHRFQAETLGDHCLPTTISTISRKYALEIQRELIQIRNRFGTLTHVMRYWFSEEDKIKINSLR